MNIEKNIIEYLENGKIVKNNKDPFEKEQEELKESYKQSLKNKKEREWKKEWQGMPEFEMEDLTSFRKIVVHFRNQEDIDKFAELIGQKITKAPSLWYPEWEKRRYADKRYIDES